MALASKVEVRGQVAPGFEGVLAEFERNFVERGELGASVYATVKGETVVNLSAGVMDRASGRPWERDTRAVVWSATKGLVAIGFLILTDRGLVDPDERVAHYWPGFGREGKERITVRQLLNHRGGLINLPSSLKVEDLARPEEVKEVLERAVPVWKPGTNQGYHAVTWGAFAGELFRQITGVPVGQWLAQEVFGPLSADTIIGLPVDDPIHQKVADVIPFRKDDLFLRVIPEAMFGHTCETRVFRNLIGRTGGETSLSFRSGPSLGSRRMHAMNDPQVQAIELPWCGAITSAEGLARCYTPLANGGSWEGVTLCRPETIEPITKIQTWSARDLVLQKPIGWSQGFTKDEAHIVSPRSEAFGHTGMGGSVGFADPTTELAFGYVMNRMDWRIRSPRCIALCRATYRALGVL